MNFASLLPNFAAPALCASTGSPDDWFPPSGGAGMALAQQVKAICRECPCLAECAAYALSRPGLQGVWAGMTEKERRDTARGRRGRIA